MSESTVVAACLARLARVPRTFVWRNNTGAHQVGRRFVRYGLVGSADIIGVSRGRFLAVECKVGRGVQSPAQARFQRLVEDCGGVYLLVRSVAELDDAMRQL